MKHIVLLIIMNFSFFVFSQEKIVRSDFPEEGDSVVVSVSEGFPDEYTKNGNGITWDFSDLSTSANETERTYSISDGGFLIKFQFGPFAPDDYQASYFQPYGGLPVDQIGNFLPIEIESVNRVIKATDEEITIVGYTLDVNGQQVGFKSEVIETSHKLPLAVGDTYQTEGVTFFDFNPIVDAQIRQYRERKSVADGYGTIVTPYQTYKNVIRVHHSITELDSIQAKVLGFSQWIPIQREIEIYEWWGKDYNRPVMKIRTQGAFGTSVTARITYLYQEKDPYIKSVYGLYPNPSNENAFLKTKYKLTEVKVYDSKGKVVIEKHPTVNFVNLNTKKLAAGVYTIAVITKKNKQSFKLIVN